MEPDPRAVVVTGMGVISALGPDLGAFRRRLISGQHGLRPIDRIDVSPFAARVGGQVPEGDLRPVTGAELGVLDVGTRLGVTAAAEALASASLGAGAVPAERIAVVAGRCQGSLGLGDEPPITMDLLADAVAALVGADGPRIVISTACAASTNAIGLAADLLDQGDADVVIAGGADALQRATYAGFAGLQALCPSPCMPYSVSSGLNLGEGGAFLVLERAGHARERGAPIRAAVLGYGLSADAHHPTAPDPTGRGPIRAVMDALDDAGLGIDDVDYVNGHGTGTPANDRMERQVVGTLFGGDDARAVPMSSTKSLVGHTLGASGAIEAIACAVAIEDGVLPPTANVPADHGDDIDIVANRSRPAPVSVALSNNYAFGGNNASLILGAPARARERARGRRDRAVITGLGAVGAPGVGAAEWVERLLEAMPVSPVSVPLAVGDGEEKVSAVPMPDLSPRGVVSPRAWRQMDSLSRQAVVAARAAVTDAGFRPDRDGALRTGVFFATGTGPGRVGTDFELGVLAAPQQPNLLMFPNTTLNAAAGHVCTALGFRGPTTTITTGGISGLVALKYAADTVAAGRADAVLVVSSDEVYPTLLRMLRDVPGAVASDRPRPYDRSADGTVLGEAAVGVLVESEAAAARRDATPYATVAATALTSQPGSPARVSEDGRSLRRALASVVRTLGRPPVAVVGAAAGVLALDRAEAAAIADVLGDGPVVTSLKAATGECSASSGLAGVLVAADALRRGVLVPTAGVEDPLPGIALATRPTELPGGPVAVNAMTTGGGSACVALSAPDARS